MLISANKKVFLKNHDFLSLSLTKKLSDYNIQYFQLTAINLMSINVSFLYIKAMLLYKVWLYHINLTI